MKEKFPAKIFNLDNMSEKESDIFRIQMKHMILFSESLMYVTVPFT